MYIPRRVIVGILLFIGIVICYILRICLSVAIVPCAKQHKWDTETQGLVLSSFYWGYITTQVPGGWLSKKYGTKQVLSISIIWASLCTIIFPFTTQYLPLAFAVRVLTGIGEGVSFPAAYNALALWFTRTEKSTVAASMNCGSALGVVISLGVSPVIVSTLGWESVFYLSGGIGILWSLIWGFFVTDSPDDLKSVTCCPIDSSEVVYIKQNQDQVNKEHEEEMSRSKFSFLKMLSHPAVLALGFNHFAYNWGWYVFTSWLPQYMHDSLHFTLEKAGIYSFLPYVLVPLIGIPSGMLVDLSVRYKFLTLQIVRKIFVGLSMFLPATFLFVLAFYKDLSVPAALVIMTSAIASAAFAGGGYQGNHIDLSTKYASMLWGFTNTLSTLPGIFGVAITGFILNSSGWWLVFFIAAVIYVVSAFVYLIFGKAEQLNFEIDMPISTQILVDNDVGDGSFTTDHEKQGFISGTINASAKF